MEPLYQSLRFCVSLNCIRALQHNTVRPVLSGTPVPVPVPRVLQVHKLYQSSTTQHSETCTEWNPCTNPYGSVCLQTVSELYNTTQSDLHWVEPLYLYQSRGSCRSTNCIRALQHNTVRPALSGTPVPVPVPRVLCVYKLYQSSTTQHSETCTEWNPCSNPWGSVCLQTVSELYNSIRPAQSSHLLYPY